MTLGRLSATRRNSPVDVGTMLFANLGVSIPVFVLGLLLAFLFAVGLRGTPFALPPSGQLSAGIGFVPLAEQWGMAEATGFPRAVVDFLSGMKVTASLISGQWETFVDALKHMILPMVALGTIPLAVIARMTRSSMLDVLGLDYIRTARAKGASDRLVVSRHAFRNALLPVVTVIGLSLGALLSGAVLTESIFLLPGLGTHAVRGDHRPRLHRGPGAHARHGRLLRRDQPDRRRLLRLPRSSDPAALSR